MKKGVFILSNIIRPKRAYKTPIRADPYYSLLYAIKEQAFRDLASNYHDAYLCESTEHLIRFCDTFFIENKSVNDVLLIKALLKRATKLLKKIIHDLENLQIEVLKMKIDLSRMYDELMEDAPKLSPAEIINNKADLIEDVMEEEITPAPAPTPAPTQAQAQDTDTDEAIVNDIVESEEN